MANYQEGHYQSYGGMETGTGGGFMQGQTNVSPASGSQGHAKSNAQRVGTVTPVTIYQINSAARPTDDSYSIDGREIGQVKVMGIVRSVDAKSTKLTYGIEDHTGAIDVVQWVESETEEESTKKKTEIREGMYVRAIGHIKTFTEKRSITSFHISNVTDPNELTHHFLDALHTHLMFTKGPKNVPAARAPAAIARPVGNAPASARDFGGPTAGAAHAGNGFDSVQGAIVGAIQSCSAEQGMSVRDLVDAFRGRFTEPVIRKGIEWLSNEGHLYSTIDDEHFKSTDN